MRQLTLSELKKTPDPVFFSHFLLNSIRIIMLDAIKFLALTFSKRIARPGRVEKSAPAFFAYKHRFNRGSETL